MPRLNGGVLMAPAPAAITMSGPPGMFTTGVAAPSGQPTFATQRRYLAARLESLKVQDWLKLTVSQQRLVLTRDAPALKAAAQLDGCYVVETYLKTAQGDAQTIHDRYKDLALVERDFRTLKTGHLEFRPWFVCTADNTQAHALTSMLALKVRRHLERAWWSLEVTVEEGLRELEKLCVMELIHPQTHLPPIF